MRLSGCAYLVCALLLALGCTHDQTDPVGPPMLGARQWDGIFRYCKMFPSTSPSAGYYTGAGTGYSEPCPVQPNPTPARAYFGSSNTGPVVFNFNGGVTDVRAWLDCSNCPTGMRYTLFDTNGVAYEDQPLYLGGDGNGLGFQADDRRACKKVVITPPDVMPPDTWDGGVWAFLFLEYNPLCQTGDWVLDEAAVRNGLKNELQQSRPNWQSGEGRKERGGFMFQREDDGSYFLHPLDDPNATMCETGITGLPEIPVIPGARFVAEYHTHMSKHLEPVTGCRGQKPGENWKANRKLANANGGGSDADWNYATLRGRSMYVIDYDNNVWRLDPHTPEGSSRRNNRNRWEYPDNGRDCLERA